MMKVFRIVMDTVFFALLVAALVWCAFLFTGAYSQHRLCILFNEAVLKEIQTNLLDQAREDVLPNTRVITAREINQLKQAQKELFDCNTISLLFQFITLLLLTMGSAVVGLMYGAYRRTEEAASSSQEKYRKIEAILARFVSGRNSSVLLAVKYAWLHMLGEVLPLTSGSQREGIRVMMTDYQQDILNEIEEAFRSGDGLEEGLFVNVTLDAAIKTKQQVRTLRNGSTGFERDALDRLLEMSSQCLERLNENGNEFVRRFNEQWQVITGEE